MFPLLFLTLAPAMLQAEQAPEENPRLLPTQPAGAWTLQWDGRPGRTYFVQQSHDLRSWTYINTLRHGSGVHMLGAATTGSRYFLRLRHTDIPCEDPATADFDDDGLSNADELLLLTDPFLADSDTDGFRDGWEMMAGLNPNQSNAAEARLDADGDGWDTTTEHLHGTNPNEADSDGDGLDDPDDAEPTDATIDWPRSPEATRVWIPLTGYVPATHGAPVALSNTGIALFEKAVWKAGVWLPLQWQKPGPELSYPDQPLPLQTTLKAIHALDLADDGRVLGEGQLLFSDPRGGDLGRPGTQPIAVQWVVEADAMIMEITGEHTSGGLDLKALYELPQAAGVTSDGLLFTLRNRETDGWEWSRHAADKWRDNPNQIFAREGEEFVPRAFVGGISTMARNALAGGSLGVRGSDNGPNRLFGSNGSSILLPGQSAPCGALDDSRQAIFSIAGDHFSLLLPPQGSITGWRPVPKLAGAAAFNARGEAISHDGRFWQNGKWLTPVSEGNTPPPGTMHLHDLNDHGVMLASAGAPAGNGQTGMPHGVEAGIIQTFDLDFIKPGTENDNQPVEIDERLEDEEGEVVGINWDDDNNSEGGGGHGKLVFKNDYDDDNGTEGEDDMILLRLHAAPWPGTKARLKYDNTMVKIWRNANRTSEIKSEETEIDIGATQIVYLEGRKLTTAETPLKIEMQVKPPFAVDYAPGDKVSVHVATPVITFQGKHLDTDGDGSKNLASQLHSKDYLGKNRRDDRNNTVILKGMNQEGKTLWYSVDIVDQSLPDLTKVIKSKPYLRVRKANLDKEMKMAMSLAGAHVYYGGHSNFGLGPNFNAGPTTTIDDYMNISGRGITAICIKTNDPENPNPMLDEDHGGPGFALRPGDVHGNVNNYTVYGLLKFDGPGDGVLLQKQTDADGTSYHYTRSGEWITVVNSSGDLPVLKYASCFMASCNSGRNFGESLNHGVLIYTRGTTAGIIGKDEGQEPGDLFTGELSWGISHYVKLLTEGKQWAQIVEFFNQQQFFWEDAPGPAVQQLYKYQSYPAP